jgi:hypothetical protein
MLIDLVNRTLSVNALAPQNLNASTQGASNDFSNAKVSLGAVIEVGAYSAGNTNLQVQIEESSTGTNGWTAISGMVVSGITNASHNVVRGQRTHRYVRANAISVTGTTPSVYCSVTIISEKEYAGTGGGYSRSPST